MSNKQDVYDAVKDMFSAYHHSSGYKDAMMMEIMFNRKKYEQNLDDMWAIYGSGNTSQIIEYQKGIDNIKSAGLKVLRNPLGKHKITYRQ